MHPFQDYERVYIINLASRKDRYREMSRELERVGMLSNASPVRWFEAVRPSDAAGFPSIGARGCFLSHLGVLENAHADGLQRMLILEDDVNFCKGFGESFAETNKELREKDWSLFYGGYAKQGQTFEFGDRAIAFASPDVEIMLAHFLGVRGDAIGELCDYLRRILTRPAGDPSGGPMHVDGAYGWYRRENPARQTYVSKVLLGMQRSSRTDIHDLRWFDRMPLVRELAQVARRLKR